MAEVYPSNTLAELFAGDMGGVVERVTPVCGRNQREVGAAYVSPIPSAGLDAFP